MAFSHRCKRPSTTTGPSRSTSIMLWRTASSSSSTNPPSISRPEHSSAWRPCCGGVTPNRGVVQPNDFIPVLESTGLIVPVGQWVLPKRADRERSGIVVTTGSTVSVNISGVQLERDRIIDDVQDALSASGFDPAS